MQRILTNVGATLPAVFYNDESTVDADGAVTVTITKGDGSVLVAAQATVHGAGGSGAYSYVLAPQASVNLLTATWSGVFGTVARSITTQAEIVGGTLFGLAEGRASDASLADTSKFTTAQLIAARLEVEQEFERICDVSFFTRYARVILDGRGSSRISLPNNAVTTVRSVNVIASDGTLTPFTNSDLAGIRSSDTGVIERVTGIFASGSKNIIVEYEHGLRYIDEDVRRVAMLRFRSRLTLNKSNVPDRASTFTVAEGGTFRLDQADALSTGISEVDAVLARPGINHRVPGLA